MLPPGFARAFQNRIPETEDASQSGEDGRIFRDLFIYIVVFVTLLLTGEFFVGHALIQFGAGQLEADRRTAIIAGWDDLLAERKILHERFATDIAHRDRAARAFAAAEPGSKVHNYFTTRANLTADLDLVLAVGERNRLYYARTQMDDQKPGERAARENPKTLRDRALEKEFLEITALKVHDLKPVENYSVPATTSVTLAPLSGPLYWHYITKHGDQVYLLTLSAICEDNGYPVEKGFALFGYRLERILETARKQLNLHKVYLSADRPIDAYASVPIAGFRPDEVHHVVFQPRATVSSIARQTLHALLIVQALLTVVLLTYGLPYFYRPHTTSDALADSSNFDANTNVNADATEHDDKTASDEDIAPAREQPKKEPPDESANAASVSKADSDREKTKTGPQKQEPNGATSTDAQDAP